LAQVALGVLLCGQLQNTEWLLVLLTLYNWCNIIINPLNPELNPICYLLALLGAHHFLHVSRI